MDPCWYSDFHTTRHETVYLVDWIDNIEDSIEYMEEDDFSKDNIYTRIAKIPTLISEMKEEILQRNIYSFVFDW